MRRILHRGINFFFIISLAACAQSPGQPPASLPSPDQQNSQPAPASTRTPAAPSAPIDPVRLAWFWNSPRDEQYLPDLAQDYDFIVFTAGDEEERLELTNNLGSQAPVLQYMLFNGVGVTEDCETRPYGNQIANQAGDFCTIRDQHPNWLLYDSAGAMIYNDDRTYVRTNPENSEWRAFFAKRLWETQQAGGWKGVFLDNVDASLERSERIDLTLPLFPTDASLQAANEEMLAYLYLNIYQPAGLPMYANIPFVEHEAIWYRYLNYLDGAMLEDFAVGWNGDYKEPAEWEWQMTLVEGAQDLGKNVFLVSQGEQYDVERQEFAFASYLLVNQGRAYFRYTHSGVYNQLWPYENYQIDLGQPLGRRSADGETWLREFENATVTVNPVDLTSQITFK
ncbi:MAG: hypothetical protein GYA48_09955 [Chloroflexi bacterium]|nr:hypothetical protein [Chloroflexota bacterium]